MRKMSKKRAQKQRILDKLKAELIEEVGCRCEDCGRTSGVQIDVSHRIPISRSFELIDDRNNLDLLCRLCHLKVEAGFWPLMKKGKEIAEYIALNDQELYYATMMKARPKMVFDSNYLLDEEQIQERLDILNPKFRLIGWDALTLEEMRDLDLEFVGNGFKLAA